MLMAQRKYFVLHAPRQTGKTSCLLALRDYLNEQGIYHALYVNVEAGQAKREDSSEVVKTIISAISSRAATLFKDPKLEEIYREVLEEANYGEALTKMLKNVNS